MVIEIVVIGYVQCVLPGVALCSSVSVRKQVAVSRIDQPEPCLLSSSLRDLDSRLTAISSYKRSQ